MSLLDRVKKIVTPREEKPEKGLRKKTERVVSSRSPKGPKKAKSQKREKSGEGAVPPKTDTALAAKVVISPLISEKATDLHGRGHYVFKVKKHANKVEVRKAVANLYGVTVAGVRIINVPKKSRRLGRFKGYKSGYKKAIVSLKKGDKIELLPH